MSPLTEVTRPPLTLMPEAKSPAPRLPTPVMSMVAAPAPAPRRSNRRPDHADAEVAAAVARLAGDGDRATGRRKGRLAKFDAVETAGHGARRIRRNSKRAADGRDRGGRIDRDVLARLERGRTHSGENEGTAIRHVDGIDAGRAAVHQIDDQALVGGERDVGVQGDDVISRAAADREALPP